MFHLYKGVRAGGGIGDEIEPPDGDANEVLFALQMNSAIVIVTSGESLTCERVRGQTS